MSGGKIGRRKGVPGLAQPRPAPEAGSVPVFCLAVVGEAQCWLSFRDANTLLATRGRQSLRNRQATRGEEKIAWGLHHFDSITCLLPLFLTSKITPSLSLVFGALIPSGIVSAEAPKLPAFCTSARDTDPRRKVPSLSTPHPSQLRQGLPRPCFVS